MVEWNDRLVKLLEERGMSVPDLARAIDGPNFHAVRERLYKYAKPGKTVPEPRGKMMANIARALGVTEQYLRYGSDTAGKIVALTESVTGPDPGKPIDVFVPKEMPSAQAGASQMGLYGTTSAGKGALILDNEPFDQVQRSESLVNVRDPYAVVVDGHSMIPALRHGYVVHVNPHLKPQPDDICIFHQEQADGTRLACIKAFRKQTETHWHVTQFNPPQGEKADFVLRKTEWPRVDVVVYIDPRRH